MSKKKDMDKIKIDFCGNMASEVTGSATLITIGNNQYLIECGLRQSSSKINDMKENKKKMPFKANMLSCVIICHSHIDHIGKICKLVKDGFNNPIYIPKGNKEIIKHLWEDSQGILERDSIEIGKKKGVYIEPLYSKENVEKALDLIQEIDFNEKFKVNNEELTFEFIHNSHIINAASCVLWCKSNTGNIKKILYTSDIGNLLFENETPYIKPFEKITKCNYIISESTYGDKVRITKYEDRKKDIEKIKTAVDNVIFENKGRILFPIFSLGRCQYIMTLLYQLYKDDSDFNIPIYIDGKLSNKINKSYFNVLEGANLELWNKVYSWKNFKYIIESRNSKMAVAERKPAIILGSGGFMQNGRSIPWAKDIIPRANDMIIFSGYGGSEGSVPYRIKHSKEHKTITIDNKKCANRCACIELHSMSSHIQHDELLKLLSTDIICDGKIFLIHGNMDNKIDFAKELKDVLEKNNRTTGVVVVNKGSTATL